MLGYEVTLSDGSRRTIEATGYRVTDDASLVMSADDQVVATLAAGVWTSVSDLGVRLRDEWPYPHMATLLDQIVELLVVTYGYVLPEGLGPPDEYTLGLMNELDTLVTAVVKRAGIDPDSSYDRERIERVRSIVVNEFDLQLPQSRRPE